MRRYVRCIFDTNLLHALENTETPAAEVVHLWDAAQAAVLGVLIKSRENLFARLHFYLFAGLEVLYFLFPNVLGGDARCSALSGLQNRRNCGRHASKRYENAFSLLCTTRSNAGAS
jgi:hypothetical protein